MGSLNANQQAPFFQMKSSGEPLTGPVLEKMSQAFGTDFSPVRIHTDAKAVQMNRKLGANAFTHGKQIFFDRDKFRPESREGKRLLAHELTHVVQQNQKNTTPAIQCDLALEPQGKASGVKKRALSAKDIAAAKQFNKQMFSDPFSLKTIRDVIGVPQYPAVVDDTLIQGVARWQEQQGIAQDGQLGPITVMFIVEELQAENQPRLARLLKQDFKKKSKMLDIDRSHCACKPKLQQEIAESQQFMQVYQNCGAKSTVTTGDQVESCVKNHFTNQGVTLSTAGTTSSSGRIRVNPQPGPCGKLLEKHTLAHEQIHSVHTEELKQKHGRRGRAFDAAFNDAKDWAADEVNSRRSDIAVARWMIKVLDKSCQAGANP